MKKFSSAPWRSALIVIALGLVILGQVTLFFAPEHVTFPSWQGLTLLGAGLGVFALALVGGETPGPAFLRRFPSFSASSAWLLAALFFEILAAYTAYAFERRAFFNFIPVVAFWLFGAGAYLMAFLPSISFNVRWKEWWLEHRRELLLLGIIFGLAVGLRFYGLGQIPRVLNGDEARIGLVATQTVESELTNPFTLWENIGALYLQAINLMFDLFGRSTWSLRLLPALAGSFSILATYLLARQIAGKRVALITVFLLATSHTHLHFSRTAAVSYIQGNWLIPLEMYFLLSGVQKRSAWRAALSGILVAIHFSVYLSSQLSLGVLLLYLILGAILLRGNDRPQWRQALAFLGGAMLALIPEVVYAFRNPNAFFDRLNINGAQASGWLELVMRTTGKTALQIFTERIAHVFLSFIHYPAIEFYGSPVPVLSFLTAIFFLLGLVYILFRLRSSGHLLLNGYFWGVVVSLGLFAIPPDSDSYRILMALPAALLIAALGLDQTLQRVGLSWRNRPVGYAGLTAVILLTIFAFNFWVYFVDFAGRCRFGNDPETRFASYLGQYVANTDETFTIYLLSDEIFFYGSHATPDFLTNYRVINNFSAPIGDFQSLGGETLIASPRRQEELRAWAQGHPGGHLDFEYDCGELFLVAYHLPYGR